MSQSSHDFMFRIFGQDAEQQMTINVTESLLRSQDHIVPVLDAFGRSLNDNGHKWNLHLKVEDTDAFDIEFARITDELAISRIRRRDLDAVLILLENATGHADMAMMLALQQALEEISESPPWEGIVDWVTQHPPPLASMVYLRGESENGLNMLGMCMADRFFHEATIVRDETPPSR